MARDLTPVVKRSRREGMAIHPKAHKIMVRRKAAPGVGPMGRRPRVTQYGTQLREKQKIKRLYGVLEKPFRRLVGEAVRSGGITGENLLKLLERRLDNVVYRLHLAPSRQAARQLVSHGHFLLNERRVDVPSIRVKPGDEIKPRSKSAGNAYFKQLKEDLPADAQAVSWLSLNRKNFSAKVTGLPTREEVDPGINEQLIIEYYSR